MVNIDWLGPVYSSEKEDIVTLLNVMIVLSSLVFSIVMVMMVYAIWKYRAKPGDESDGEPIHGNTRLEIIWTAIPTVIVIFAGVYSTIVLNDIEAKADNGKIMEVDVTAQQFAWRFDYPEQGVTSTELHVPVGTQLDLHLNALDVIHFVLGAWSGGSSGPGSRRRPTRWRRHRRHGDRHADRGGRLLGGLHRALRMGPRDDARGGGGRVAGRLRRLGGGSDQDPDEEDVSSGVPGARGRRLRRP